MSKRTLESTFAIALLVMGGVGCGAANPDEDVDSTEEATLSLKVANTQLAKQMYQEVNVDVQSIGLQNQKGQKTTIAFPRRSINLLQLEKGVGQMIAHGKLAPGQYHKMWMQLGKEHSIRLPSGKVHRLSVQGVPGQGLVLPIALEVKRGQRREMAVDFDIANAIRRSGGPLGNEFVLSPNLTALEPGKTGTISGQLKDLSGKGIPGAEVFAEACDQAGQGKIVRRGLTDQDGKYKLPLLPFGQTYHVVSQPNIGGQSYGQKASQGIPINQQNPFGKFDAGFEKAPYFGGLQVQVNPKAIAQQTDTCSLMQQGLVDGKNLVVGQQTAGQDEQTKFDQVPSGNYAVQCERRKIGWDGSPSSQLSKQVQAAVKTSQTEQVNVQF